MVGGSAGGDGRLRTMLETLDETMDREGMDALAPGAHIGVFARPRRFELAAAMNRLRTARFGIVEQQRIGTRQQQQLGKRRRNAEDGTESGKESGKNGRSR